MKAIASAVLRFITVSSLVIANMFLFIFDLPKYPTSELDMSKFEPTPVFAEEFNGTEINEDIWSGHYTYGNSYSVRKGGYWHRDMASVHDGNLYIKTAYMKDGLGGGPAGWYTYAMDTNYKYEQTYGYFECRCMFPKGFGHWSAFWMLTDSMFDVTEKGLNGAEIDVFESFHYGMDKTWNSTKHTIHIDNYGEEHQSKNDGSWLIDGDPYNEFHTYGVEWNEDGYTFYIDGKKTSHTNFGGASRVPEYMILSVEIDGKDGVPSKQHTKDVIGNNEGGTDFTSEFVVDYVRAYQYKQN